MKKFLNNDHGFIKEYIRGARSVALFPSEKESMKAALMAQTGYRLVVSKTATPSPYMSWSWHRVVAVCVVIFLLTAAGTSFAAERALPGDFLYPVKLNVNEKILSTVEISTEGQAAWDVTRVDRRIGEAEALEASEATSSSASSTTVIAPQVQNSMENEFVNEAQTAEAEINDLTTKDPKAAAALKGSLNESLKVSMHVFTSIETRSKGQHTSHTPQTQIVQHIITSNTSATPTLPIVVSTQATATQMIGDNNQNNGQENGNISQRIQDLQHNLGYGQNNNTATSSSAATSSPGLHLHVQDQFQSNLQNDHQTDHQNGSQNSRRNSHQ